MESRSSSKPASAARMNSGEVERVFKRIDEDGDGKISAAELGKVVRALGSGSVSESEVEVMIQEMDSDRDGFVDINEFADFHKSAGVGGGDKLEEDLKEAFDMYDLNRNGVISAKELHRVLEKLGENCSVQDCARMIRTVDSDGDGCVNFEEFKAMMGGGGVKNQQQQQ